MVEWIRLQTSFPRNHKILALRRQNAWRAITVYMCGLAYAGEQNTGGFIPREALDLCYGTKADVDKLVEAVLWRPDPGGWIINGWEEYQPTPDEVSQRKEKARAAAAARWNGHTAKTGAERAREYRARRRAESNGSE